LATAGYFAGERRIAARNVKSFPPDVGAYVRRVYFHFVEETLRESPEAPAAGKQQRSINPFPRTPTPPPANDWGRQPAENTGTLPKSTCGVPAGPKQKSWAMLATSVPGPVCTRRIHRIRGGGALTGPSTPSAPLAQGICFNRGSSLFSRTNHRGEKRKA